MEGTRQPTEANLIYSNSYCTASAQRGPMGMVRMVLRGVAVGRRFRCESAECHPPRGAECESNGTVKSQMANDPPVRRA